MLTQTTLKEDLWLCRPPVSDEAAKVWHDVGVSACAIRSVVEGGCLFVWPWIDRLGTLIRAPHHGSLVTAGQATVVEDHVGVTTASITCVTGVLRVESTMQRGLEGRVWVSLWVIDRMVTSIGHASSSNCHFDWSLSRVKSVERILSEEVSYF